MAWSEQGVRLEETKPEEQQKATGVATVENSMEVS